jgi:hypothetical protein
MRQCCYANGNKPYPDSNVLRRKDQCGQRRGSLYRPPAGRLLLCACARTDGILLTPAPSEYLNIYHDRGCPADLTLRTHAVGPPSSSSSFLIKLRCDQPRGSDTLLSEGNVSLRPTARASSYLSTVRPVRDYGSLRNKLVHADADKRGSQTQLTNAEKKNSRSRGEVSID